MEALVLCPEELRLGPVITTEQQVSPMVSPPAADLSLFSAQPVEKGTRFWPWKGTVRNQRLPHFDKLPEFDIRHRFGLYDDISDVSAPAASSLAASSSPSRSLRQCNWIRFLRYALVYSDAVNVVATKSGNEPVFEVVRPLEANSQIVAFFVPDRPEEALLLPALTYLRHSLFKRFIDTVREESPLDLSTPLAKAGYPVSPTGSDTANGRKSVSSDCTEASSASTSAPLATAPAPAPPPPPPALAHFLPSGLMAPGFAAFAAAAAAASALKPPPSTPPPPPPPPPLHILSVESLTSQAPSPKPAAVASPPAQGAQQQKASRVANAVERSLATPLTPGSALKGPGSSAPRRREKNMLPCSYCGKAFDRPSLLKRHVRIHTGERPHVCDICSKGFSTSSSLNTHRRIHSGEKPHQCGVCGKRFTASSNLYYHKMTHVKEKPHKCTMCSKSFPTPGDLKSHTYVHTGTWPFKCHICHRGFSKQTNLKNHLLLHSGDKPFSCDLCHKKFALSCNLRAHLKTHETEEPSPLALYQRALAVLNANSKAAAANAAAANNNNNDDDDVDDEDEDEEEEASSRASASPPGSQQQVKDDEDEAAAVDVDHVQGPAAGAGEQDERLASSAFGMTVTV